MPKPLLVITGGLLASVVLAGCGLNGNRNATPAANGTIYVRGTLKPSKSFSPATAITLSSSGSVGTTPSPTRSSSAAASSPPTTSSHRGSSSFNTVVLKAFEAIQGHTQAVIGGPTKLPPAPFSGGYLTAHTHTSVHHLEINLLETSTPHAVNTVQNLNALGGIASWGRNRFDHSAGIPGNRIGTVYRMEHACYDNPQCPASQYGGGKPRLWDSSRHRPSVA